MLRNSLFLLSLVFFVANFMSCTSDKKIDKEAVKKEIKSREIKKATEAEIVSKVLEIGNTIALKSKKALGKKLKGALQMGGVENAISFCNVNAMPLVDSLSKVYEAEIKRVTLKARNPNDLPNDIEKKLLEAYAYQWKDSIPLKANVQAIDDSKYLFSKPILIDNELCLKCHGSFNNGFTQETDDFLKTKYPIDKATDYNLGDLRGMWSITIAKKKVVQSL